MKTFKEFLEGFTYGDKEYQDKLQKAKREAKEKKEKQRQDTSTELYKERTQGRGIRATEGGVKGWIKNKKFTPGNW
jgi:hypothetical protein